MCLFSLQFAIDRRVLVNAVDINGEFELHDVSHDILKNKELAEVYYMMHLNHYLIMLITQVCKQLIMLIYYNI